MSIRSCCAMIVASASQRTGRIVRSSGGVHSSLDGSESSGISAPHAIACPYQASGCPMWNQTTPSSAATTACKLDVLKVDVVVEYVLSHPLEMSRFGLYTD
jgi:hypothetical protein